MTKTAQKKILLIDDDILSVKFITHILHQKGLTVESAQSGKEGMAILQEYLPHLILLDVLMPGEDGYQVSRKLKSSKELKEIPVIFITASNNPEELIRGFEAGGVDFIAKPLNKEELLARVETHIDLKLSRDLISQQNRELNDEIERRKQTEEKFRALSEMTQEGVLFINGKRVVEANRAAREIFGIEGKNWEGDEMDKVFGKQTSDLFYKLCNNKSEETREVVLRNKGGKEFFGLIYHRRITYLNQRVDVLAIRDITLQKEMDKKVFNAVLETEERERKRFSQDMHDGLGALLSALKIYLNLYGKGIKNPAEKGQLLEEMKNTISQAITTSRTIANNIMPSVLIDYGLIKAIREFTESLEKAGAITTEFIYPADFILNDEITQTHVYRIVLELINNTLKHAQASKITICFKVEGNRLNLEYTDNGKGFNYKQVVMNEGRGQGLSNITNRINYLKGSGGFQQVDSGTTKFVMEIPI